MSVAFRWILSQSWWVFSAKWDHATQHRWMRPVQLS